MADESRGRSDGRNRRRRYFKRKGERAPGEGENRERQTPAAGAPRSDNARAENPRPDAARETRPEFRVAHDDSSGAARNRNLRKRRRSRTRRGDQTGAPLPAAEQDDPYSPPQTVYIYEHVVRPSAGNYEYRAEPFSKAGRTLDDYSLDLSPVFSPAPREPVGQVIARVFAEYEAADALEAARSGLLPAEGDELPTLLSSSAPGAGAGRESAGSESSSDSRSAEAAQAAEASPWVGRNPDMAAAEAAIEAADEAQEPPPNS